MTRCPSFPFNNPDNDSKFDAGLNEVKGAMDSGEMNSGMLKNEKQKK